MIGRFRAWVGGSIVRKLWGTYFLVILATVGGITAAVYHLSAGMLRQQAEQYNYRLLESVSERLDSTIMQLDNISYFIYQEDVQRLLNSPLNTRQEQVQANRQLASRFYSWVGFLRFNVAVQNVYMIMGDGLIMGFPDQFVESTTVEGAQWYQAARQASGRLVFLPMGDIGFVGDDKATSDTFRFGAARWVFNTDQYEPLGALVMEIEIPEIRRLLGEGAGDNRTELVVVSNATGEVVYTTSGSMEALFADRSFAWGNQLEGPEGDSGIRTIDEKPWLVNTFYSAKTDWYFITLADYSHLTRNAERMSLLIVGICLAGFLMAVLFSTVIARRITVPIKELQAGMRRVRDKSFSERIPVTESDEIGDLQRTFNEMIEEIEHLIVTVYEEDLKEKQATLDALQAQINPHFLYNTLDTINSMAVLSDNGEIAEIAVALSNMFGYAIRQDRRMVTLREELANLGDYIGIQRYRFGERFRYDLDIPEELYDCEILRLTLQPLVENAIVHGLEPKVGGGTVGITARQEGGYLRIVIQDDGIGVEGARLAQIRDLLANGAAIPTGTGTKIGIANVNQRLRLFFGGDAGLAFSSEPGKGSRCEIQVPAHKSRP